ncbi:MAG: prepilin peptidase [Candidatus Thorarchaeota archaeon]
MVLDLSIVTISSFCTAILLLVVYSYFDIRDRMVKNEFVVAGGVVGCAVLLLTGHFVQYLNIHVTALLIMIPLVLVLFNIGAIGGADAKILLLIALLSPGIELGTWNDVLMEAAVGLGGYTVIMLAVGYIYWRVKRSDQTANPNPPLIPMLLIGYLATQLIALF